MTMKEQADTLLARMQGPNWRVECFDTTNVPDGLWLVTNGFFVVQEVELYNGSRFAVAASPDMQFVDEAFAGYPALDPNNAVAAALARGREHAIPAIVSRAETSLGIRPGAAWPPQAPEETRP